MSPDVRANSSPPTTVAISSATSIHRWCDSPPTRANLITSSMMSLATQRLVTGTTERVNRSTIIAAVYPRCVSQTKPMSRGTSRSAASRSRSGGLGARGSGRPRTIMG